LNFLRDGIVPRHLTKSDLEYLFNEAEYFGITELIKALNGTSSSSIITVEKIETIPDHIFEFGLPRQENHIFHFDTMRGYSFEVRRPVLLDSAQLLVSGDKSFSAEAFLFQGDEPTMLQNGTKTSDSKLLRCIYCFN